MNTFVPNTGVSLNFLIGPCSLHRLPKISKRLLTWIKHADLKRIKGVERQYSGLLEAAGVDTVVEFAQRIPENLPQKMLEINAE